MTAINADPYTYIRILYVFTRSKNAINDFSIRDFCF